MDRQQVSIVGSEDMNLVFNFPSFYFSLTLLVTPEGFSNYETSSCTS